MSQWWVAMFSEFIGTAVLILLGNGVNAATTLKRMGANQSGRWVATTIGWGFAVFAGALISMAMGGGGYLNPAVLIMNAITSSSSLSGPFADGYNVIGTVSGAIAATFFITLIFIMLGAMFGQTLLNFINFKFIKDKENSLLTIRSSHCTAPAYKNKEEKAWVFNLSYEFVGTAVLLGAIIAISKLTAAAGTATTSYSAIPVTFIIMAVGFSLGSATGYAINPARDLCPRIIFAGFVNLFRKDDKTAKICDWEYSWVPVTGPMIAGIVIGCFGLIN